nr:aminotransferase class I/II-fold pyridoxal phosphate-dependent enzyme [uncultured Porphyromonas sp.]
MIEGHGDDLHHYQGVAIRYNFSSNVPTIIDHTALYRYLSEQLPLITSYPEPSPRSLEVSLAEQLGIAPEEVMVTNGATEAIYLVAHSLEGKHSAIFSPSFSEYADAARLYRHTLSSFSQWPEAPQGAQAIWCGNPNNPTGHVIPKKELVEYIQKHPEQVFVFDQSYASFSPREVLGAREALSLGNVILVQSLTKSFAIPGLRLGYLVSNATTLGRIRALSHPWSVNTLAIEAGKWLLQNKALYEGIEAQLLESSRTLRAQLSAFPWLSIVPTDTHFFIFHFEVSGITSADLKEWLARERGILVRDATNMGTLGSACIRVASQGEEADQALVDALRDWYQQQSSK